MRIDKSNVDEAVELSAVVSEEVAAVTAAKEEADEVLILDV